MDPFPGVGAGDPPWAAVGLPDSPILVGLVVAPDGVEVGAVGCRGGTLSELDTVKAADGLGVPPLLGVGAAVAPSLLGLPVDPPPAGGKVSPSFVGARVALEAMVGT